MIFLREIGHVYTLVVLKHSNMIIQQGHGIEHIMLLVGRIGLMKNAKITCGEHVNAAVNFMFDGM